MANYSSVLISLFVWIIIITVSLSILYRIFLCLCPNCLHLGEPEDMVFEPEPLEAEEVQMGNIAGQEVVIDGFVD